MEKQIEVIILYWHDALMHGTEQISRNEAEALVPVKGWVAGLLVAEKEDCYVIAMDWFDSDQFRQVHVYPKSGVELVIRKVLKEDEKLG